MERIIEFAFVQCGYEINEVIGNDNIHSKKYVDKTTYYDGDTELFSICNNGEIVFVNRKNKDESREEKLKGKRLEIINILLDYEKEKDIDPTTFYCMWAKTYNKYCEDGGLGDNGWGYSFRSTKAQYPTWIASYIRYYHGVENHIYFEIKYSKKENKYKFHYSFYIDESEIKK